MLDIDHFKLFNDAMGHQAGDACIRKIAEAVGSATSGTASLAARYGGEEFALVLPDVSEDQAVRIAESLRLMVRKLDIRHPVAPRGYVTVSIGVATKTGVMANETTIIGDADIALYYAKKKGRNCTVASSGIPNPADYSVSLVPPSSEAEAPIVS